MKNLFKKTDGGVTFGKPGQSAELFLARAIRDELEYFNKCLITKKHLRLIKNI